MVQAVGRTQICVNGSGVAAAVTPRDRRKFFYGFFIFYNVLSEKNMI
jgi:hypothetical protein